MVIIRNGVPISLTPEEMHMAFEKEYYKCKLLDAKGHLQEYLQDPLFDENDFAKAYGFTYEEACDPTNPHFMLDTIVQVFDNTFSTDKAEDDTWTDAIRDVLAATPHKTDNEERLFRVTYKEELYYQFDVWAKSGTHAREKWMAANRAGDPDFQTNEPDVIAFSGIYTIEECEDD